VIERKKRKGGRRGESELVEVWAMPSSATRPRCGRTSDPASPPFIVRKGKKKEKKKKREKGGLADLYTLFFRHLLSDRERNYKVDRFSGGEKKKGRGRAEKYVAPFTQFSESEKLSTTDRSSRGKKRGKERERERKGDKQTGTIGGYFFVLCIGPRRHVFENAAAP